MCALQSAASRYARRFALHNVTRDRAGCHRQRTRQIHLPWTTAPGEIAVLRADHDLVGPRRNSRPSVDTGAATWLDHRCASLAEDVEIPFAHAVLARLLRTELKVKLATVRNPPAA